MYRSIFSIPLLIALLLGVMPREWMHFDDHRTKEEHHSTDCGKATHLHAYHDCLLLHLFCSPACSAEYPSSMHGADFGAVAIDFQTSRAFAGLLTASDGRAPPLLTL